MSSILCLTLDKLLHSSNSSVGEESEVEPTDLDHAQRQRMESYLWWRRGGVLTIILSFFILTATLLSVSVVYDQTIRVDLTTKCIASDVKLI